MPTEPSSTSCFIASDIVFVRDVFSVTIALVTLLKFPIQRKSRSETCMPCPPVASCSRSPTPTKVRNVPSRGATFPA